ncbi:MAG: GDP-fucose synthetase [Opitutaceae bacterium]|nr:GDP-fucose synthetase [Opitutaceae bacterium]|tara:strand:- start:1961 stop:2908 length:948 start_codon:yes stop_codon:yes gene_type:complete
MDPSWKVFVSGHRGMVGSAIVRKLESLGHEEIETATRDELDLTDQTSVLRFYEMERPDAVIIAAAKVGGIGANSTYPAEFLYENLMIAANQIHAAFKFGVKRLLFLGSSCIYPKLAPQPMPESCLLTSELEPTNQPYAIAKIAGLKLCQYYRKQFGAIFHSLMPTNLYGPGDNYDLENSHVLPALIRKFHEAKENNDPEVAMWGTGAPLREFLHVDDLADASLFLMGLENPPDWINVGSGDEVSIKTLALMVKEAVGYQGEIVQDADNPDGTPRKLLDLSVLNQLGWTREIDLSTGLKLTYRSYLEEKESGALRS